MSDEMQSSERNLFAKLGSNVQIYPTARIAFPEEISLGSNIIIDDFVFIMGRGGIAIGSHVHISSFASITGGGPVEIGDFASISIGVRVLSGSDVFGGFNLVNSTVPSELRSEQRPGLSIGRHAVIGANSVVLPGIKIADGVAVGAQSLVTEDLPPWTICVGTPAKPIKERARTCLQLEQELKKYER
jgi:galactoside O-acetyltransferase